MKINCISCGHNIDLGESYDDYKGLVKCWVCSRLLMLRSEQGCARSVLPASLPRREEGLAVTAEQRVRKQEYAHGQEAH
jgi:DNA-directed RNA polymerase subunit N (RpoN/RPB10)